MMLLYIWLIAIVAAMWLYCKQKQRRFTAYGVRNMNISSGFVNLMRILMKKEHFADQLNRSYKNFPGDRFIGAYEFMTPTIMVKDLELIKKITVKDFEHFLDHKILIDGTTDPLFGRNLFSLKGQEWKDMRSTLSPAFTSSKIRHMVPFMVEVGKQMTEYLKQKIKDSNNNHIDIDIKDLTTRFANDVVATCAFGLNIDSHKEENNQFYIMGKKAVNFSGILSFLKFMLFIAVPQIMAKLNITLFNKEINSYFKNMVMDTMKHREEFNIVRPDMIHLLMEARKGKLLHEEKSSDADAGFATVEESVVGKKSNDRVWSDNDLVAQAILFFFAGFETISSTMSFALHELAINPDVQEKLVQEIRETENKTGGKFNYTVIQNMTYMDMVVSEVLRLWPPAIQIDRMCVKDYNLGKTNDEADAKEYYIHAGEGLVIPAFALHRDPKYFPDPLKFDPERFSEENKHEINPLAYLPFGIGPRNCIGSRFALCEVKVMLYQLLLNMEVTPNEKTCIPSRLNTRSFNFSLNGGHWLRLKMRN